MKIIIAKTSGFCMGVRRAVEMVLADLAKRGQCLKSGLGEILSDADIPHQLTGHPNMQGFLVTSKEIRDVRGLVDHDDAIYDAIMSHMYENGVWPEPDAREPWFLCAAHDDSLIDETLNRFQDAVKAVKRAYVSSQATPKGNLG